MHIISSLSLPVLSTSILKLYFIDSLCYNKTSVFFPSPSEKWADKMSLVDIDKMFDDLGELRECF